MTTVPRPSVRERARRAVQAELLEVAQNLFVEHGYETTTVDQIAEAAGISKRTFFRYFATKEALVIHKYGDVAETFVQRLEARPPDEDVWTSLRRTFDYVVDYAADAALARRMAVMDDVVESSTSLRAAYLERNTHTHARLAEVVRRRAADVGRPRPAADPGPEAVVGAAFACLEAARVSARRTGRPLGEQLDAAMRSVAPSA